MSMFSFVLLVAVADALVLSPADGPCCKECKLPEKKYFSVDHGFGHKPMCGEACIDPKKYKEYHLFEKNLTAANHSDACARQLTEHDHFYNVYTMTETHGVPGILSVTLDFYAPGSCAATEYCCPEARHCLTPVKPGTLCTGAGTQGSCSHGEVCCPVTNECVRVGPECTPP